MEWERSQFFSDPTSFLQKESVLLTQQDTQSALWPHASSWEQMVSDPVNESADVGVDTRLVLLAAAVAPAHHPNNIMGPVTLAHQRASRVTLQGQRGGSYQGSLFLSSCVLLVEKNHTCHRPGRSPRLLSGCLHRTCCRPASLRKRGGLYISPGRSGGREHPAAGWYRTSLRQEESVRGRHYSWKHCFSCTENVQNTHIWNFMQIGAHLIRKCTIWIF